MSDQNKPKLHRHQKQSERLRHQVSLLLDDITNDALKQLAQSWGISRQDAIRKLIVDTQRSDIWGQ